MIIPFWIGLLVSACTDARAVRVDTSPSEVCRSCHGNELNAAPPRAINGAVEASTRGVGAHQAHLISSAWHAQLGCDACHLVPATVDAVGHNDTPLPAEVQFGSLAGIGNQSPVFDGNRCSNVYCHGSTLSGGALTTPEWTTIDGTQIACGSCHGLPPSENHPNSSSCETCHGEVIATGHYFVAPDKHIDGTVEVSMDGHAEGWSDPNQHGDAFNHGGVQACSHCHGDDLAGGNSGVGCDSCHPAGWQTNCTFCHGGTHNNTGAPPEGVGGETAATDLHVGAHDLHVIDTEVQRGRTCNLCHMNPTTALSPGHIDTTPRAETTFAGLASGTTYTQASTTCATNYCHGDGNGNPGSAVWTANTSLACNACHDDNTTSAADFAMSGAHFLHVKQRNYACSRCHNTVVNDAKQIIDLDRHVNGVKDVAIQNGTWDPTANGGNGSCTPECHEALPWFGGGHPDGWTEPTQHGTAFNEQGVAACASCHGTALQGSGSAVGCDSCHDGWQTNCSFCHGGADNNTGAPPEGVAGETLVSNRHVGAHTHHVADTLVQRGRPCGTCHLAPTSALSPGHIDGTPFAEVVPSGLASGLSYNANTTTCGTAYCHGDGRGNNGTAVWTSATTLACNSCHDDNNTPAGSFNMSGEHYLHVIEENKSCSVCHGGVVNASKQVINLDLHINGVKNVQLSGSGTWNATANGGNGSCDPSCHGAEPWYGN